MYLKNISSVIIEGGAKTLNSFIEENLWDEARIFIGDIKLNEGIECPQITNEIFEKEILKRSALHFLQ